MVKNIRHHIWPFFKSEEPIIYRKLFTPNLDGGKNIQYILVGRLNGSYV